MKLPQRVKPQSKPKSTIRLQGNYEIEISGLTHHGQGVGRIEGKTVFVDQAIPGDQVEVRVFKDEARLAEAKLLKILQKSTDRVEPFCRYFGECGGCRLQMQTPTAQIHWKQTNFLDQLKKSLNVRKLQVEPAVQAENLAYRRRAKMVLVKDRSDKTPRLGFKALQSEHVVDIEQCPILTPALNETLKSIRTTLLPMASRQAKDVFLVEAENGVWVSSNIYNQTPSSNPPQYSLGDLKLNFDPQGFIQTHAKVNRQLVEHVIDWLAPTADTQVLDLFCGVGNFTLPLARKASLVVGVEGNDESVDLAKMNAENNGLNNIAFYQADLDQTPDHQAWWSQSFDAILLDPGRLGAKSICSDLSRFNAKCVVYVSCQSSTLIRDLQALEAQGYRLKRAQIFDMFPHTDHFESLVLLEKVQTK